MPEVNGGRGRGRNLNLSRGSRLQGAGWLRLVQGQQRAAAPDAARGTACALCQIASAALTGCCRWHAAAAPCPRLGLLDVKKVDLGGGPEVGGIKDALLFPG